MIVLVVATVAIVLAAVAAIAAVTGWDDDLVLYCAAGSACLAVAAATWERR